MAGSDFGQGLGQLFSGMFGDSGAPYQKFMDQFKKYMDEAQGKQNPFYESGTNAIPQYQDWLGGQKDPASFINGLMNKYQESPFAKFQTKQGQRAINNAASASGTLGSSPMMQESADYAENVSSKDMQNWLSNALGVNTQYGQGLGKMMGQGQNSANALSELLSKLAQGMGEGAYGEKSGEQTDMNSMIKGFFNMFTGGGGDIGSLLQMFTGG